MQLRICQQNINKSLVAQTDLLHRLDPNTYNIAALQEPYLDHNNNTHANPHWYTIYPMEHYIAPEKTISIIFLNKCIATDSWTQVDFASSDVSAVQVQMAAGKLLIINTYNHCTNANAIDCVLCIM